MVKIIKDYCFNYYSNRNRSPLCLWTNAKKTLASDHVYLRLLSLYRLSVISQQARETKVKLDDEVIHFMPLHTSTAHS